MRKKLLILTVLLMALGTTMSSHAYTFDCTIKGSIDGEEQETKKFTIDNSKIFIQYGKKSQQQYFPGDPIGLGMRKTNIGRVSAELVLGFVKNNQIDVSVTSQTYQQVHFKKKDSVSVDIKDRQKFFVLQPRFSLDQGPIAVGDYIIEEFYCN